MMLAFAVGFLVLAIVASILSDEVGIVVVLLCVYGVMGGLAWWGLRRIMRGRSTG